MPPVIDQLSVEVHCPQFRFWPALMTIRTERLALYWGSCWMNAVKLVHFPTVFQGWKNDQGFLLDNVLGNPLNRHPAALGLEKFQKCLAEC